MNQSLSEQIADALELAVQRPRVIAALHAALRAVSAPSSVDPAPGSLVAKADAARALGISVSTVDRLARDGAPVHHVGGRRRFDVAEFRTWLDSRGQRSPSAKPVKDSIEVDDVLRGSGLRVAGGGR
jgi:excisionase family DNA binding protein